MAEKQDDLTKVNEGAHTELGGNNGTPAKMPKDAKDVQDVNEVADAEFIAEAAPDLLGNNVGGLRGSSD